MNETMTTKLNNGIEVTAKFYKGELFAVTYANRTQAEKAAAKLGSDWAIYQGKSRFFYVTRS